MFRFANPSAFWLILIIPIVLFLWFITSKMKQKKLEKGLGKKSFGFLTRDRSTKALRWKLFLQSMVLLLLVIAYARPQLGQVSEDIKSEGVEMVFAVDVSNSMLAEDVKPNRLELAKKTLERLMGKMVGHKIGLVGFAGTAALIAPMTNDYAALRMYIDSLSPKSVGTQGTRYIYALNEATDSFKRGGLSEEADVHATRVIVIVSDGEDNEPGALEKIRELYQDGTRIFTIAVGTEKGAPIPVRDGRGELRGYKKDKTKQVVVSKMETELLKQMAKEGGGAFYYATFGGSEVDALVGQLDKLDKAEFEKSKIKNFDDQYQFLVWIAFVLAMIDFLLFTRRKSSTIWRGRFEVGA